MRDYLKNFDWWLALAAILLSFIGILIVFGAKQSGDTILFYKQSFFLMAGVFLMFAISFFDYRRLKTNSSLVIMLYLAAILALAFFATVENLFRRGYKLRS